jgi:hypothetical protein
MKWYIFSIQNKKYIKIASFKFATDRGICLEILQKEFPLEKYVTKIRRE